MFCPITSTCYLQSNHAVKLRLGIENKIKWVSSGGNVDQKFPDGVQTATRTVTRVNGDADDQEVTKPIGTGMQAVN